MKEGELHPTPYKIGSSREGERVRGKKGEVSAEDLRRRGHQGSSNPTVVPIPSARVPLPPAKIPHGV